MLINKEGKLFGKVSIIDIFALLLVVVMALGIYMKFFRTVETTTVENCTIEYEFKVTDLRMYSVTALQQSEKIFDEKTKEYMGEIVNVEYSPSVQKAELADGRVVMTEAPDKYDAVVTIRVKGGVNNAGYFTEENKAICAGSKCITKTKFAKTEGEIISVKKAD
ncbi:MAG: DUF4330 domain-containing protein [Clostridia bacterium]|nr:DUF4330 domain-containing protein [Clostridia bacterium]